MYDCREAEDDFGESKTNETRDRKISMRSIRNCNVAVVGGAGFLGSHLVNHLIDDRQCNVLVVDNLIAGRREFIHPKAQFAYHDITGSEEYLKQLLVNYHQRHSTPLYVMNYAARPYIPDCYDRPLRTADVNFMGALKVINAAQEAGAEGILQVSSAEIYGNGGEYWRCYNTGTNDGYGNETYVDGNRKLTETSSVIPHSSYGAAKAAIDALVQVRWRESKTPCIALRQFNCVGERETHPYIVPEIISQLSEQKYTNKGGLPACQLCGVAMLESEKMFNYHGYTESCEQAKDRVAKSIGNKLTATIKLGNNSSRDFMYAGDAVKIAVLLLEHGQFGEVYNLGSETSIKIYDLAKKISHLMGLSNVQIQEDESRKRRWEIWNLTSDNTKLYSAMQPKGMFKTVSLDEALRKTIAYYNENGRRWAWEK